MSNYTEMELFPEMLGLAPQDKSDRQKDLNAPSKHKLKLERFRNLDLTRDLATESGYRDIFLKAIRGIIPRKLIAFSKASRTKLWDKVIHFFEYDYVIDAFWNNPREYLGMLKRAYAVIGPDYSFGPEFPYEVNMWDLYRIRVLSHFMQKNGVRLIPNIPVCSPEYYEQVFSCHEPGGIYAVSNVQAYGNYFSRHQWFTFVRELIKRLRPEAIIVYGNRMEVAGVKAYYFENENIINLRKRRTKNE